MKSGREKELKFRIGEQADYLSLRDDPRWGDRGEPRRQVNHYFDTPGRSLASSRILLRIRSESGKLYLTLKCGTEPRPGYFDSLEIEEEIAPGVLDAALRDPGSLLELPLEAIRELNRRVSLERLVVSGRLENERVDRLVGGLRLEVDRLVFPDGTESYELEVESEDVARAEAWIRENLGGAGIRLEPQRQTKMEQLLGRQRP